LGFGDEILKVFFVNLIGHYDHADVGAIHAFCQVAFEKDLIGVSQVADDFFDDLVHANIFAHEALNVVEDGVEGVHLKYFSLAFGVCDYESGFFEAVQLEPDGIGAFAQLGGKTSEMPSVVAVQEELQHQFDAGFRGDESFQHVQ